jgi:pimeloyl-ACP methyl ester carboxylesterase
MMGKGKPMTNKINTTALRFGLRAASVAAIAIALAISVAQAQQRQQQPQQQRGPLVLKSASYFYIGGKIDTKGKGSPIVGHMYVEYMIPQQLRSPYPIVMVHGGNQTGTNFTGTPDGREGWAQYFVRRGYAVYVVDQVARGRSAHWNQVYGDVQPARLSQVEERFVAPERFPMWPQAKLHTQWPGTGRPGDPEFDQFYAAQAVSLASFPKQQEVNPPAIVSLLEKIGPSILMIHSQSGAFAWPVADKRPDLVKMIVAVEPNGPPVRELQMVGAPDWFKDGTRDKLSGLGEVPLNYDPPLGEGERLSFVRQEKADGPELAHCWLQKEPARKLKNLANVPVAVIMSEASYHAPYDHCTVAYLRQAGVPTDFIKLAEVGVRGNGHMMMLEKNSDDIARVIEQWTARQVANQVANQRAAKKGKKK